MVFFRWVRKFDTFKFNFAFEFNFFGFGVVYVNRISTFDQVENQFSSNAALNYCLNKGDNASYGKKRNQDP